MLEGIKTIIFDLGGTLKKSGEWAWHPESEEVCKKLSRKYDLVIGANQPKVTNSFLEKSDIKKYFKAIFISSDINLHKPDEAFFEHILNSLSIKPEQTAMVGDSLTKDIEPAGNWGIRTIWIPRDRKAKIANEEIDRTGIKPDYDIKSLVELLK